MSLAPGARLGPYEVVAAIGMGGMGEVYRARDTRLGRSVALKVLHQHVAQDAARRQRFEREAQAVSRLNHPNICTLHDVGQHDGNSFLVMELLDGETLAHRLKKGSMPLAVALRHALEIAVALEQAHRCGIAHRDLKPANIMLTRAGAKLLDFGIAKLIDAGAVATRALDGEVARFNPPSSVPTSDHQLTESGTILGTVEYMAPEQLQGQDADERSDVFAFGALVYEMICGRRAFNGDTQAEVIGAILMKDPPPMAATVPAVPPLLENIIQRCFSKERDERWQKMADLVIALQWVVEGKSIPAAIAPRFGPRKMAAMLLLATGTAAVVTSVVWRNVEPKSSSAPANSRWDVAMPPGQTLAPELFPSIAVSPDGSRVVFRAQAGAVTNLYVRDTGEFEARVIADTENAHTPFFSADGQWLGFLADGKVRKVSLSGESAQTVCEAGSLSPTSPGATWSADGTIVFAAGASGLMMVSVEGRRELLTTPDENKGEVSHMGPQFLPGGRVLLYTVRTHDDGWRVALLDMATRRSTWLPPLGNIAGVRYASSGHLVYSRDGALEAIPVDLERHVFTGPSFPLGVGVYTQAVSDAALAQFAMSNTGLLAFASGEPPNWTLVAVKPNGDAQPVVDTPHIYRYPRFSPDGQRLVVAVDKERSDVWLIDVARGTPLHPLTSSGSNTTPVWTPDGSRITFSSRRRNSNSYDIYSVRVDDPSDAELLFTRAGTQFPSAWTPDGQRLLFYELNNETARDIWTWTAEDAKVSSVVSTKANERAATPSSDGRWLAFVSDVSGRDEIYVRASSGTGEPVRASRDGGTEPVWARRSNELFFRKRDRLFAVVVSGESAPTMTAPRFLLTGPYVQAPAEAGRPNYDVAPDGQSFVMVRSVASSAAHLHVVQNVFELMKGR